MHISKLTLAQIAVKIKTLSERVVRQNGRKEGRSQMGGCALQPGELHMPDHSDSETAKAGPATSSQFFLFMLANTIGNLALFG